MPMLEERESCRYCYGTRTEGEHDDRTCHRCLGSGRELTELGRELVRFLEEHYGVKPRVV